MHHSAKCHRGLSILARALRPAHSSGVTWTLAPYVRLTLIWQRNTHVFPVNNRGHYVWLFDSPLHHSSSAGTPSRTTSIALLARIYVVCTTCAVLAHFYIICTRAALLTHLYMVCTTVIHLVPQLSCLHTFLWFATQ